MNTIRRLAMMAMAGALVLAGCATDNKDGPIKKLSRDEADSLNAEQSSFENAKDPAFSAQTHYAAGQLAESQGAYRNAIEQYRGALKLDSRHLPSLYRMGVLYAQLRDYPNAIATWQTYIKETNGDATAYSNLGFCHELAGHAADAESAYQAGVAKDPANRNCRINYGLMLARTGRVNEASAQLRAVLTEAQVHYNLGSVHEQQGRREQARTEYHKALELDPNLVDAQSRLAAMK